jgi:uncharacterized protein (DUF1330 family)
VLNLIDYADRRAYRWYGVCVVPTIYGVGGSIRWGGEHHEALLGEPLAHTLLVVRYPTHRHFLLMTVNPYYALINRLRVRGVARFAASFTRVLVPDGGLRQSPWLLGVHFTAPEPEQTLTALAGDGPLRAAGCLLRYASREFATFDFLRNPAINDPNPLPYATTALFHCPDPDALCAARRDVADQLTALGIPVAHVYRRAARRDFVPRLARRP